MCKEKGFKFYLIQPMNKRSEDEILDERQIWGKIVEPYGEILDTYFTEKIPNGHSAGLYLLGKSIQAMSKADRIICLPNWWKYRGCRIEYICAKAYKKKIVKIKLTRG